MCFTQDHALMHMLSPVDASTDSRHIYLALISAILIGDGWWGGFLSHMFAPAFWSVWNLLIRFFFKTRYSTPWIFSCYGFSEFFDMDIHLRDPLHPWGSFFLLSQCLWRFCSGFRSCLRVFPIVTTQSVLSVLYDILGGLWSCCQVLNCMYDCLSALLWDLDCPLVPGCLGGSQKLS